MERRRRKIGFWYRLAVITVKPLLLLFTRRDWRGASNIPVAGPVIVVANHVSHIDPLPVAHFLWERGRLARYLAKESLFRTPGLKWVVRGAEQIPVHRNTATAIESLRDAVAALQLGRCLVIYPEGTITKDPAQWPMRGRTGAARLALETGAPVVPLAQWGPQLILGLDDKPHLLPRKTVQMLAGPPIDLSAYAGRPITAALLHEVTDHIMRTLRDQVAVLRGQNPPEEFFDLRAWQRSVRVVEGERRSA